VKWSWYRWKNCLARTSSLARSERFLPDLKKMKPAANAVGLFLVGNRLRSNRSYRLSHVMVDSLISLNEGAYSAFVKLVELVQPLPRSQGDARPHILVSRL